MRFASVALSCYVLLAGGFFESCSPPESKVQTNASDAEPNLELFAGTYGEGDSDSDAIVTFAPSLGNLLMHPALWTGPMVLRRVSTDSFVVSAHPRFGVQFITEEGRVSSARVHGLSEMVTYERLGEHSLRPIQLLQEGRPEEAARSYVATDPGGTARFVQVGRRFLRSTPTRSTEAVAFFTVLSHLLPDASVVHGALGDAHVFVGNRGQARPAYERAVMLDPSNEAATLSLQRLGVLPASTDDGWNIPFSLEALFVTPQPQEIDSVWTRWQRRDLSPRGAEVILRRQVDLDGIRAEARVIAHQVHGQRHLGVVIVPDGALPYTLPVLVETKGVSASFSPLEVPTGLTSPGVMGESRHQVVYVVPGYRGEQIVIGADTLTSEGDRSDAWDGATDDTIALLRVALENTPEADTSRVCVFGRSRGGTVALLAGIRERQVDCVVSWAAPTDWFSRMDLDGWTQRELVEDGLRNRAIPGETGGQFINYFLSAAREGRRDLQETRLHLIASSPLYFAQTLPLAQVHWGLEDTIVPSINGVDFVDSYNDAGRADDCLDIHFHPKAGHDQDRQMAPIQTRSFILASFDRSPGDKDACRR